MPFGTSLEAPSKLRTSQGKPFESPRGSQDKPALRKSSGPPNLGEWQTFRRKIMMTRSRGGTGGLQSGRNIEYKVQFTFTVKHG
jgi:hypothetical protein